MQPFSSTWQDMATDGAASRSCVLSVNCTQSGVQSLSFSWKEGLVISDFV